MKLLHLADLHLGKQLGDLSLLEDQSFILKQILHIAIQEKVNAVLISGDVYQRSSPQAEAMKLFDSFVSSLVEEKILVFVISGNHDSALRISYLSSLIQSAGVYVTEAFSGTLQHVTMNDQDGDVTIWMMPFLRPAHVKRLYPEEKIITYQDAVATILRHADMNPSGRNVLMCHQFVTGCETCDSEELSVGGLDHIDAALFNDFDYVALGHIHKPQKLLRETVRYAGSPLKYSFSEATHRKSVAIIDIAEKGNTTVHTIPLHPLHDVRILKGKLEDLVQMDYSEDYVWITIHDELPPPDAKVSLSVNFPNMLKFSIVNSKTKYDSDILAVSSMENKSVQELFSDFYRMQNNDQAPSEKHMQVLRKVILELEEKPHEAH